MRSGPGIWALGLATSGLLHLGAGAGLMAALQPEPVQDQPVPESRLNVEAHEMTRSDAAEQAPNSESADAETAQGARLDAGAIAQSAAASLAMPAQQATAQDTASLAKAATASATQHELTAASPLQAVTARPSAPKVAAATSAQLQPIKAASSVPQPTSARAGPLPTESTAASIPDIAQTALQPPEAASASQSDPEVIVSASLAPPSVTAPEAAPDVTASKAVLAFPTEGRVDPVSLAAFQSFTQSADASSTDVRDSLSAALSIPCSRMQVTFDPDTAQLQLTGHIPEAGLRAPVMSALQAQMGADIAVSDNLLILPAPQCAALSGIAGVGLPQSTDQITNPMIVGADAHARAFRFVKDLPLVIEMGGPDYDAYVYVDYFDADGNVIHLTPNAQAPQRRIAEKEQIVIGARTPDDPGLYVLVGPPFGQEIAAAFAASVPLYEGNRPLIEPAAPYLEWLTGRVAQARADHADFKGEWVYFFVTTAAE